MRGMRNKKEKDFYGPTGHRSWVQVGEHVYGQRILPVDITLPHRLLCAAKSRSGSLFSLQVFTPYHFTCVTLGGIRLMELFSKDHSILEKGRMEFQPFGQTP